MILTISILTHVLSLFIVDTVAQGFNPEIRNRVIPVENKTYYNKNFIFCCHTLVGWIIPFTVLLIIIKWYLAIPIFFVNLEITHRISKKIFSDNSSIIKTIVNNPLTSISLPIILFITSLILNLN